MLIGNVVNVTHREKIKESYTESSFNFIRRCFRLLKLLSGRIYPEKNIRAKVAEYERRKDMLPARKGFVRRSSVPAMPQVLRLSDFLLMILDIKTVISIIPARSTDGEKPVNTQ